MRFSARGSIVDHYTLCLKGSYLIDFFLSLVVIVGSGGGGGSSWVCDFFCWDSLQLGKGAKLHGELDMVTTRVILLHRLDHIGKDGFVFAGNEVGDGGSFDRVDGCANHVSPRGTDPFDGAVEVEINNDVEGLCSSFPQLLTLFTDVLANGSFHDNGILGAQRGEGRGGQRGGRWGHGEPASQ